MDHHQKENNTLLNSKAANSNGGVLTQEKSHAMDAIRQFDIFLDVVRALDVLIAQSSSESIHKISKILHQAKEQIIEWAVHEHFYETEEERFRNRYMHSNALFAASDLLGKLLQQPELLDALLKDHDPNDHVYKVIKTLRSAV